MQERNQITINTRGNYRIYHAAPLPRGTRVYGTVRRGDGSEGALIRFEATGVWAMLNAGVVSSLPQQPIANALQMVVE